MTLSKTIIYGTDAEVANALLYDVKLDELDEYGYSPLIQAAIVDSITKAELLLNAGANANFSDLTGRTALHWATDNGNFELSKLLLQRGANANAYTYAGQPVLVIPLLRKQIKIRRLLISHGANLDFAQDFINAKLLGHRYELQGRSDIVDNTNTFIEIELEGFYLEFSLDILIRSLCDFRRNFGGKHLRKYFTKIDAIIELLRDASELARFRHYLIDVKRYENRINRLLENEPLILPLSFDGHAISLIKYYDLVARCDRGEFGKKNAPVIFYEMHNLTAFTKSLCKELLYKRQDRQFINQGLAKYLNLEAKYEMHLSLQRVGNCAWANIEAILPTMIFLFLLEEKGIKKIRECESEALNVYDEWVNWDKNRSLHFCLESFYESDSARKASKAALLAAIIFQACDYKNDKDQEKARKILSAISLPEYDYILKSYIKVFSQDRRSGMIKNLYNFLDDFRRSLVN